MPQESRDDSDLVAAIAVALTNALEEQQREINLVLSKIALKFAFIFLKGFRNEKNISAT